MTQLIQRDHPQPAAQTSRSGADLLVQCLVAAGVRTIFGLPGDTGVALYDALHKTSARIQHVLTRDERHAAAMADAYARVLNRVGAVEVSSGGGVSYVIGGLGEAFAAGVPVLVITSDIHSRSRGTGALTEIDQMAMFSGCTKWRTIVTHASEIPGAIAHAFKELMSGRPAPVAVIVPEDVLDEVVEPGTGPAFEWPADVPHLGAERPAAETSDVAQASEMLTRARRPVILAGSGVHTSGAWAALEKFASRSAIPVATSIQGKGAIAETHPFALGVVGNNGGLPFVNEYVHSADVALLVGTRANATDTSSFTAPDRATARVIHLDIDRERSGRTYPSALRLTGDARATLEQLARATPEATQDVRAQREGEIAEARKRWEQSIPRSAPLAEPKVAPQEIIRVLATALAGAIVVVDPGTATPNVAAYWRTSAAGRSIIAPRGHGPMGYAIPAAIGAAFARPGSPILALTADGSFAMACGELETAARFNLPILFVQFTNGSLGWIKMLQHLYYGKRYFGVDPGPINATEVARACGLKALRPKNLGELEAAVAEFVAAPEPTYIDLEVPHVLELVPPVSSWIESLDRGRGRPVY